MEMDSDDQVDRLSKAVAEESDTSLEYLDKELLKSPEDVLRELTENGLNVEFEAQEIASLVPDPEEPDDADSIAVSPEERVKRWRVEYNCEDLTGFGIAPRKEMARQVAAFDLLEKLDEHGSGVEIPKSEIPLGCRISPFIYDLLSNHCKNNCMKLNYRFDETVDVIPKLFTCYCSTGRKRFVGYSYRSLEYAKKYAAKFAFEALKKKKFPFDEIVRGESCEETDYKVIHSESCHVYVVTDEGCDYYSKSNLFPKSDALTFDD